MQDQPASSPMRVIIVEDEAPARSKLVGQLAQIDGAQVIAECADPVHAIRQINALKPDVVLLDIELGELSGFDVLEAIEQPCHVIFTTAYSQYAVAAFEKRALDYLLKPFELKRLQEAFARVAILYNLETEPTSTQLAVKTGDKTYLVQASDIRFVSVASGIVVVKCQAREYHLSESLESLAAQLPATFVRVHRNCIVNSNQLSHVGKWKNGALLLRFKGVSETVTTSRRGAALLRSYLRV